MVFLAEFNVIEPAVGLIFWTLLIFLLFWLIIGRFAFRPIANALKNRENHIQEALDTAEEAKKEMMAMKAQNEELLAEAREERSKILRDAKDMRNRMIQEAKDKAKEEANQIVAQAQQEIENQKNSAIAEVKSEVGRMAVTMAEKILRKQLSSEEVSDQYLSDLADDINLN